MEKYLPLKDFPNYEVSSSGNIRHIKFKKILKPQIAKRGGYLKITLCKNNKIYSITIHRAVAISHLDNPKNYPEVDHKDGNKWNNNVSNLRWVTKNDNLKNQRNTCYPPRIIFNQYSRKFLVLSEGKKCEYEKIEDAVHNFLLLLGSEIYK
jgi:hypothetical protein